MILKLIQTIYQRFRILKKNDAVLVFVCNHFQETKPTNQIIPLSSPLLGEILVSKCCGQDLCHKDMQQVALDLAEAATKSMEMILGCRLVEDVEASSS